MAELVELNPQLVSDVQLGLVQWDIPMVSPITMINVTSYEQSGCTSKYHHHHSAEALRSASADIGWPRSPRSAQVEPVLAMAMSGLVTANSRPVVSRNMDSRGSSHGGP